MMADEPGSDGTGAAALGTAGSGSSGTPFSAGAEAAPEAGHDASSADLLSPLSSNSGGLPPLGGYRGGGGGGGGDRVVPRKKQQQKNKRRRFGSSGQQQLEEPLLGAVEAPDSGASTGYGSGYASGFAYGAGAGSGADSGYASGPLPTTPRPSASSPARGSPSPSRIRMSSPARDRDREMAYAATRSAPLPRLKLASPRRAASAGIKPGDDRGFRSNESVSSVRSDMHNSQKSGAPDSRSPFNPDNRDTMYHKLKYYGNLQKMAGQESARMRAGDVDASPMPVWRPQLLPPAHVLPAYRT